MRPQVGVPIAPDVTAAAALRSGVWKRKFSWTASQTPAFSAILVIATASSQVGANGFWTMVAMPRGIVFSTIIRWVSIRVMMSMRSIFSLSSISSTFPYQCGTPNSSAAALALAGSMSQTATIWTPSAARSFHEKR